MHVYVSIDLEGVAGIGDRRQVHRGNEDYGRSRSLMAGEANAVIAGAYDAGAELVVINDSHGDLCNLRPDELDQRAQLQTGSGKLPNGMMFGVDTGFDAAIFVGYHAMAGTTSGVLEHSFSSATVAEIRVNGAGWGEAEMNAAVAGRWGIPVVLITGDDVLCDQVATTLPGTATLSIKNGLGYRATRSLSPAEACRRITAATTEALTGPTPVPFRPTAPFRLEIDFLTSSMAEYAAMVPGTERPAARTVAITAADIPTLVGYSSTYITLASHGLGI